MEFVLLEGRVWLEDHGFDVLMPVLDKLGRDVKRQVLCLG
jgi:hypothetical protein